MKTIRTMRFGAACTFALVTAASSALAQGDATVASAPAVAPAPVAAGNGLAVVALGDAQEPTWSLARSVYADPSLRPSLDEAHARVLAGEAPAANASPEIVDLAATRAAIHGDDAASRRLLGSLASELHVRGLVLVSASAAQPDGSGSASARVFVASSASFDAATYGAKRPPNPATVATTAGGATNASDAGAPPASDYAWSDTVRLLAASYGTSTAPLSASAGATGAVTPAALTAVPPAPLKVDSKSDGHKPFYASPWFWGAIGAAAFGGLAVYFATKDSDSSTTHLQLQVPR